jgi:hypothetical protein
MGIEVSKLIGKNLVTKKMLPAFNFPDKPNKVLFTIPVNGRTGEVYSYIQKPSGIWLQFRRSGGSFYYILFAPSNFVVTSDIKKEIKIQQAKDEKELIKEKGQFAYYFEKYGKFVFFGVIGAVVLTSYFKNKK